MDRRAVLAGLAVTALPGLAGGAPFSGEANAADINWLVDQISGHYAYLPDRHLDLFRLREIHAARATAANDGHAFLRVLEQMLAELHDHHVAAKCNDAASPQLIPTGADIWAVVAGGSAIVQQVRPGSAAAGAGVRAGDAIVTIADKPVAEAITAHAPRALRASDPAAQDYTLRVLLAGTHRDDRVFTIRNARAGEREVRLPPHAPAPAGAPLIAWPIDGGFVHIRIENSLGDTELVAAFDAALEASHRARGLILDLRNTPSGGDTDVAEPILGRFISGRLGYQRFLDPAPGRTLARDSWVRPVDPRGPYTFTAPLVVLVDHWTGSMGEGMAIGLDGMRRAVVVGTRMAGLCGATSDFALPLSGIGVNLPTERTYHLDGTPRELWRPNVFVDLAKASGGDPILKRGIAVLRKLATR